jgi:hypothetical protein
MRSTSPPAVLLALLLACSTGCQPPAPDDDDAIDDDDAVDDDDIVDSPCVDPWTDGPRMRDEGLERGLDVVTFHPGDVGQEVMGGHTNAVASDLDGDGDVDLITYTTNAGLLVWENDGSGHFDDHQDALPHAGSVSVGFAAVDLDGDRLPEIVSSGWGHLGVRSNLGNLTWGAVQTIHSEPEFEMLIGSFHLGDLDGDQDLDLFVPVQADLEEDLVNAHHLIFLQEDGTFVERAVLQASVEPLDTQAAAIVDVDNDGLMDIVFPGDQGHSSALFINQGNDAEGVPTFEDVAGSTGWDMDFATMGLDGADANGDGVFDWLVGDIGAPAVLMSFGDGWIDSGDALGVVPEIWQDVDGTVGWSVFWEDMNNDGALDIVQASAPHEEETPLRDLFWIADGAGRFEDLTDEWGVAGDDPHFGASLADFDGDGFLDYVATGMGQYPYLLMNTCSEDAWIELDFAGPPGNQEGWGVTVELDGADGVQTRALMNLLGQCQRPAVLHFGLGQHGGPVDVVVRWPDGEETGVDGLVPYTRHRIEHPDS